MERRSAGLGRRARVVAAHEPTGHDVQAMGLQIGRSILQGRDGDRPVLGHHSLSVAERECEGVDGRGRREVDHVVTVVAVQAEGVQVGLLAEHVAFRFCQETGGNIWGAAHILKPYVKQASPGDAATRSGRHNP